MVAVAVRDQDEVGLHLVRLDGGGRVAGQEGVDEDVCAAVSTSRQAWPSQRTRVAMAAPPVQTFGGLAATRSQLPTARLLFLN